MSNLRSLSSRQKNFIKEAPMPAYNKTAQPIKLKPSAKPTEPIKKEQVKPKITIADAIGHITIRLGKVEQFIIDFNLNGNALHSYPPIIDQNQNMNTKEDQLLRSLERIQDIEKSTKNIDNLNSDLIDTKNLLIKLMSKQEKNLEEQEVKNANIHDFINNRLNELVEKKVNELLNNRIDEIIFNKIDELVNRKVNELLKKTADEIVTRNIDEIISVNCNYVEPPANDAADEAVADGNADAVAV